MKRCKVCLKRKRLTAFDKKGSGHCHKCKACRREYWRAYYADPVNRARHIAKNRRHSVARDATLRAFLHQIKREPCKDCGLRWKPWQMQFDHRPGTRKLGNVSEMLRGSKQALMLEIKKCDLVCANCHADRTYRRQNKGP
jgi:hypothetical protein